MPVTYNGIGTRYVGKSNASVRQGICRACNRTSTLHSYDTRLWFVVLFIPVIPLGRKRILDECSSCHRHFVAKADQWEEGRQLATSGAMAKYRESPSRESALVCHAALLSYHEFTMASTFRTEAMERFPGDGVLMSGCATHMEEAGQFHEAIELHRQAFDLDPRIPASRISVALQALRGGDCDRALELMSFLRVAGASRIHPMAPLEELAQALQSKERHQEALDIFRFLLDEISDIGNHHLFRKWVTKSEKALGTPTILPPRQISFARLFDRKDTSVAPGTRKLAYTGLFLAILAIGALSHNFWERQHASVFLVNSLFRPVDIEIDGNKQSVDHGSHPTTLAEGMHRIRLGAPMDTTFSVTASRGFWGRWFGSDLWVLDVSGVAVLDLGIHRYGVNPPPSESKPLAGDFWYPCEDIDFRFEPAPASVSLDNRESIAIRRSLTLADGAPAEAAISIDHDQGSEKARLWLERRIKAGLTKGSTSDLYLAMSMGSQDADHAEAFLRSRTAIRPVDMMVHRAYQSVLQERGQTDKARHVYDSLLASEPNSAVFLYLRGRLEKGEEAVAWFQRSVQADTGFAWPRIGLAWQAMSNAQWNACHAHALAAQARGGEPERVNDLLWHSLLGLHRATELDQGMFAHTADDLGVSKSSDIQAWLEVQLALGNTDKAWSKIHEIQTRYPTDDAKLAVLVLDAQLRYGKGDTSHTSDDALRAAGPVGYSALFNLMTLRKDPRAAFEPGFAGSWNDPERLLALAAALEYRGYRTEAKTTLDSMIRLAKSNPMRSMRDVGELLSSPHPTAKAIEDCDLFDNGLKSLVYVVAAQLHPELKNEFFQIANRFAILNLAPNRLVRTIANR